MKTLADYLKLHYPVEIQPMPDGMFCAEMKDIPGCARTVHLWLKPWKKSNRSKQPRLS